MIPLTIFGQNNILTNIDVSTLSDIQITNIIFAEHSKLSIENSLLNEEINYYKDLEKSYAETDSLQKEEIGIYLKELTDANKHIKKLKTSLKRLLYGASIGGIFLFILGLIL